MFNWFKNKLKRINYEIALKQIIDYINTYTEIVEITLPHSKTNSRYLRLKNGGKIRISNHIPNKDNHDLTIIISNCYAIQVGHSFYCFGSFKEIKSIIFGYIVCNEGIENRINYKNDIEKKQLTNQYKNQINSRDIRISDLQKKIEETTNTVNIQREQIKSIERKIVTLKSELKEKDADCKEAANLLEYLSNVDNRKALFSNKKKTYYLDNFPDDVREFIEDLIKEYYD